jgi:poly-gamma-glutamate capsule biosynthesis protein CapA/YwtB (metallophosphatase superfamily)
MACGDVGVKRAQCDSMFAHCAGALRAADLCLAQLETTMSERGAAVPHAKLALRAPIAMARAVRSAGFSVMSFAGNHCLDFGYEGFRDTLRHAAAAGIRLCGAGDNLAAARAPVYVDIAGTRVAVLAASSILPEGYAAESTRAGCAPMRAHTLYEQTEPDQPGTPPKCRTFAHRQDLAALLGAISSARANAEVVLVSLHWGLHMVRSTLADYQIEVAHAAIDAGADAILGHHPHVLKGVEIYRGRPIFYSLGNFAIEQPHIWDPAISTTQSFRHLVSLNPSWNLERAYTLPEITRLTGIAILKASGPGAIESRFRPAWIDDDSVPHVLADEDPRFAEVAALLRQSSHEAGFNTRIVADGDELRMLPAMRAGDVAA